MLTPAMTRKGVSALDWIRTNDTRFRRAVLYPLSYEGLGGRLPADRPAHDQPGIGVAPCSHCTRAELRDCCASPLGLAAPGSSGACGRFRDAASGGDEHRTGPWLSPFWPALASLDSGTERAAANRELRFPSRTYLSRKPLASAPSRLRDNAVPDHEVRSRSRPAHWCHT